MKIKRQTFDGYDHLKIWDRIFDESLPDFNDKNIMQLDNVSMTFALLATMHYQILNGGVIQFIDNASGDYFHETLDSAKRINFNELIEILTKASEQFPDNKVPKDWTERRNTWDKLSEKYLTKGEEFDIVDPDWTQLWEDLDQLYYSNETKLYQLTIEYLKKNATLIE